MLLISFLGALVSPVLMFANGVRSHYSRPDMVVKLENFYGSSMLYSMLMFSLIVYVVIAAFLFSREYAEKTLKTIITAPVSKGRFINAKFITLFILIIVLSLVSWAAIYALAALYHYLFGLAEFNVSVVMNYLGKMILSGMLMFMTISPFVFLSLWTKGLVVPVISAAAVAMGNVMLSYERLGAFYPWTASYLLISGEITATGYPVPLAISLVAAVSILGFLASVIYFKAEDIR